MQGILPGLFLCCYLAFSHASSSPTGGIQASWISWPHPQISESIQILSSILGSCSTLCLLPPPFPIPFLSYFCLEVLGMNGAWSMLGKHSPFWLSSSSCLLLSPGCCSGSGNSFSKVGIETHCFLFYKAFSVLKNKRQVTFHGISLSPKC